LCVYPWKEYEIALTATQDYANPYTDVHVEAEFIYESGLTLRRPAFWDGGRTWKIRFASPGVSGDWTWNSSSSPNDEGLDQQSGTFTCQPPGETENRFYRDTATWYMLTAGPRSWPRIQPGGCRGGQRLLNAGSMLPIAMPKALMGSC